MRIEKFCLSLLLTVIFLFSISCATLTTQEAVVKIDPERKFQTLNGWEATAQAGQHYPAIFDKYRDELFAQAVGDLGINRLRLELRSGSENPVDYYSQWQSEAISEKDFNNRRYEVVNDNDDPFLIDPKGFRFSDLDATVERVALPIKKLLEARGEKLYLNLNYVDFGKDRGNSNLRHNTNPEEYAELILAAYRHLQEKYGFVPDAIEVLLEPDTNTGWSTEEIAKSVMAAGKRLGDDGFRPAFIIPSTTSAANAPKYIDEIAKVPGAMQYVKEFAYHRYKGVSPDVLREIGERGAKFGVRTAMLEHIEADYKALHDDLKIAGVSAWQQYTIAFPNVPDNGAQYYLIEGEDGPNPKIVLSSRAKLFRQYFRYLRAGANRIGADSTNPQLDPLAFINPNGKTVVVVKADAPGKITVQGLPAATYGITYTTAKNADVALPDVVLVDGGNLEASIPASGVLTIFAR